YGGVRGVDQYMGPIAFIPERETNKLIIKGNYEDYLKAKEVLDRLDEPQPQVAIEVLIVTVDINDTKSLGAQLRSKVPGPNGLLGNNIKFQTSGLYANGTGRIITNPLSETTTSPGVDRLLGYLLNLVTGAIPGTTLLTLGNDALGVWGIFQALQTITDAEVVSNPFLLATNNTKANVALGLTRRVITTIAVGGDNNNQQGFGDDKANLDVTITPQINSDGMIVLKVSVELDEFTDPNPQSATKLTRNITTNAIVANQEVLALGGLIRNNITINESKVPILGDIP